MAYREDTFTPWALGVAEDVTSWKRTQAKEPSRVRNARIWEALMGGLKQYKADQHFGNVQQDNLDNLIKTGVLEAENIKSTEQYNLRKPWLDRAQEFGGIHDSRAEHIFEEEAWKRARRGNEAFNALHPSEESYPTYASFDKAFQNREIGEGLHAAMSNLYNAEKDDLIQFARSGKGYDPTVAAAHIAKLKEMRIDAGNPSLFSLMTGSARRQAKMQDKMIDTYRDDFVSKAILNGAVDYQIFEKNKGNIAQMRAELKDTPLSWVDKVSDDVWEDLSTAPTSIRKDFKTNMDNFIKTYQTLPGNTGKEPTQREITNNLYLFSIGLSQPSEGLKLRYWKYIAEIAKIDADTTLDEDKKEEKRKALKNIYDEDREIFQGMVSSEDASTFIQERAARTENIQRLQDKMDSHITAGGTIEDPIYVALKNQKDILTQSTSLIASGIGDNLALKITESAMILNQKTLNDEAKLINISTFMNNPKTQGAWTSSVVNRYIPKDERDKWTTLGITWHEETDIPMPRSTQWEANISAGKTAISISALENLQDKLDDADEFSYNGVLNSLIHSTQNIVEANNARHNIDNYTLGSPIQLNTALNILLGEEGTYRDPRTGVERPLIDVMETSDGKKVVTFAGMPERVDNMTIIKTLKRSIAKTAKAYKAIPELLNILEEGQRVDPNDSNKIVIHRRITDSSIRNLRTSEKDLPNDPEQLLKNRNRVVEFFNNSLDQLERAGAQKVNINELSILADLKYGDDGEGWLEFDEDTNRYKDFGAVEAVVTELLSLEETEKLIEERGRIEDALEGPIQAAIIASGRAQDWNVSDLNPEDQVLYQTQTDIQSLTELLEELKVNEERIEEEGIDFGTNVPSIRYPILKRNKERLENNIRELIQGNADIRTLLGRS